MGCIEISTGFLCNPLQMEINRNMGCIEIPDRLVVLEDIPQINRNMGCIEILGRGYMVWIVFD